MQFIQGCYQVPNYCENIIFIEKHSVRTAPLVNSLYELQHHNLLTEQNAFEHYELIR